MKKIVKITEKQLNEIILNNVNQHVKKSEVKPETEFKEGKLITKLLKNK